MGHAELKTEVTFPSVAMWRAHSSAAHALKSGIVARWREGAPVDAAAEIDQHPELHQDRSAVLDLLYEEYCLRAEAGQEVEVDSLCERFPDVAHSLRKLIQAHEYLQQNPHLWAAQQAEALRWPEPGNVFLGYDLIGELGRGAFARVFLASEPALGSRHVVVKVAHQGATEAETLGRLVHPNVVPVYSVHLEEATGLTAVCMPYLGSATLGDVVERAFGGGTLPARGEIIAQAARSPRRQVIQPECAASSDPFLASASYVEGVLHLGVQLADALAYTHGKGVLHLDLKPSNVLLTPEGRPMLLDFNLSRDRNLTERVIGGTLPYMSPEQLDATDPGLRASNVIDARSDVFSLGVILYELLTGVLPFGAMPTAGAASELRTHLRTAHGQGPKPIRNLNPQIDDRVARVIESCLETDPSLRPPNAAVLAGALSRGLSSLCRLRRWTRRHMRVLAPAALVLLVAAGGVVYLAATRDPYSVRQFEKGKQAYQRGDLDSAVSYFENALKEDSGLTEAAVYRGLTYQRLGQYETALAIFDRIAPQVEPGRLQAHQGFCLAKLKHWDPAAFHLREAVKAPQATAETWSNYGSCLLRTKRYEEARQALLQALSLNPQLQVAHQNLLFLNFLVALKTPENFPDSWQEEVHQALAACPTSGDAHLDAARIFGYVYNWSGDPLIAAKALASLEKALEFGNSTTNPLSESAFHLLRNDARYQALLGRDQKVPDNPSPRMLADPSEVALR
jgi:serine/threonine protein kinase/Flp pilus assembly protein TadD